MAHFLSKPDYDALVDALANLQPDPMEGRVTRDQVAVMLGEIGDVWPASILPDVLRTAEKDQSRAGYVS